MGNCGSSLNCGQCYSDNGEKGCLTEIEVDADIAGIGVSNRGLNWLRINTYKVSRFSLLFSLPLSPLAHPSSMATSQTLSQRVYSSRRTRML
jgi:hypothetical protein